MVVTPLLFVSLLLYSEDIIHSRLFLSYANRICKSSKKGGREGGKERWTKGGTEGRWEEKRMGGKKGRSIEYRRNEKEG